MAHVKKVKVALNLSTTPVLEKIENGRVYVTEMTGNPHFPGSAITPPLSAITTATNQLETAYQNAQTGGTAETAIMHEKESVYDNLVTQLSHHVEDVANNNPSIAESIVLSTGMKVKKDPEPVGHLPAPQNLKATALQDEPGTVELNSDKVKGSRAFIWLASPDPVTPTSWFAMGDFESVSTGSKFTWRGLTSGSLYHFKGAAIGAEGRGDWSDPATRRAP